MSGYIIGNVLGRLAISYLLIWLVMWLVFARRDWRVAFSRAHRWYGLLSVCVVFSLGLVGAMSSMMRA